MICSAFQLHSASNAARHIFCFAFFSASSSSSSGEEAALDNLGGCSDVKSGHGVDSGSPSDDAAMMQAGAVMIQVGALMIQPTSEEMVHTAAAASTELFVNCILLAGGYMATNGG